MATSKQALKKISKKIRNGKELSQDEANVIQEWRALHSEVLNTWQGLLRKRIKVLRMKTSVKLAQRLKRYPTIVKKLHRYDMCLSNMNDIAGCRLIFKNLDDLYRFRNDILNNSKFKHKRIHIDKYDYIKAPKEDGYRGIHDVYICKKKDSPIDGLRVEVQYRTINQHIWSTTVESMGIITGEQIKFKETTGRYNDYFKVCSELFARIFENRKSCLPTASFVDLSFRYIHLELKAGVLKKLTLYSTIVKRVNKNNKTSFVIKLSKGITEASVEIEQFSNDTLAAARYAEEEKKATNQDDIVMVKAENFKLLTMLFPNYFLESANFRKNLLNIFKELPEKLTLEKNNYHIGTYLIKQIAIFVFRRPSIFIIGTQNKKKASLKKKHLNN